MLKQPFFGCCLTLGRIFGQNKKISNLFFSNFEKIGLSFNIYKKNQDWYSQTKIIREIAQSI